MSNIECEELRSSSQNGSAVQLERIMSDSTKRSQKIRDILTETAEALADIATEEYHHRRFDRGYGKDAALSDFRDRRKEQAEALSNMILTQFAMKYSTMEIK